jgi:PAS domain S-box-containing protein
MDLLRLYEQVPPQRDPEALRQTLGPMLDGLSRAFGYSRALVALYDSQLRLLRGSVAFNVPEEIAESLAVSIEERDHPLVAALLQETPLRVDEVRSDRRLAQHDKGLLLEMGITSFIVVPLRTTLDPGDLASSAPRPTMPDARAADDRSPTMAGVDAAAQVEVPAAGVIILSKEGVLSDNDIEGLMPFANQAGATLASARSVELFRHSSERYAVENEWLWWMINSVADPVVVTDEQNDIIRQNRQAELIFRTRPDDGEGKKNAIRMNNFLFTAALSTSNLEHGRSGSSRELTLVDPIEGTELIFEVISHPAYHFRLNTTGMVSLLKNVTDLSYATEELSQNVQRLQSAEEKSRLERDRLDLVLRNVPNPIIVIDNEDQITQMNQEAIRLFRPPENNAANRRKTQIAASNSAKFVFFVSQLRLETAQVKSGELSLIDPDSDEELVMAVTSTELRDESGALLGNVSVMQDLTRLRELERRRVAHQLFESEKLAATGRLAASIAHEINNPLEAITNSLYLLVQRTPANDANHQFLAIAKKETERVSRILRQMLGFYRPELSTASTDINALILEAESLIEKDLRQKGVRMYNDFSSTMPMVMASSDQLKQVILNLLLNAQESMPDGGSIFITTRPTRDADPAYLPSRSVVIQVRDTGKGIAEEHLANIFEPFFSTKQARKGTGLGLWVSLGIVQRHGGTITPRSRPGEGTIFTISLPIAGPDADD